jgi:hypothetical protein
VLWSLVTRTSFAPTFPSSSCSSSSLPPTCFASPLDNGGSDRAPPRPATTSSTGSTSSTTTRTSGRGCRESAGGGVWAILSTRNSGPDKPRRVSVRTGPVGRLREERQGSFTRSYRHCRAVWALRLNSVFHKGLFLLLFLLLLLLL